MRGALTGMPIGQLSGAALGYGGAKLLKGSPRAQIAASLIGAAGGTAAGGAIGAHRGERKAQELTKKRLSVVAPEHWQTGHEVAQARGAYARGEEGAKERYLDARRRRSAAAAITRSNARAAQARGEL